MAKTTTPEEDSTAFEPRQVTYMVPITICVTHDATEEENVDVLWSTLEKLGRSQIAIADMVSHSKKIKRDW